MKEAVEALSNVEEVEVTKDEWTDAAGFDFYRWTVSVLKSSRGGADRPPDGRPCAECGLLGDVCVWLASGALHCIVRSFTSITANFSMKDVLDDNRTVKGQRHVQTRKQAST